MNNTQFGINGELKARRILRKHFTQLRRQKHHAPFDYIATDRLTAEPVAIEVKTVSNGNGKLAHIETEAFERKLHFLHDTQRKGIVMVIVDNGKPRYYLGRLQQHITKGKLIEIII